MKKPTNFTLSLVDPIAASLVLKHERNFPANARDEILARTEDNHDFDFIADPRDLVDRIFRRNGRVGTYYGESWDEILAYNAKQVAAGTPSNCVAFEDSAGTIPLLAPLGSGKGCGLLLDRSGGLVRGVELVVNGGFDTDTNWTKGTGWSISGGKGVATAAPSSQLLVPTESITTVTGNWYEAFWTVETITAGSVQLLVFDGSSNIFSQNVSSPGTYSCKFKATSTTTKPYVGAIGAGFTGTLDSISVRELPGNHRIQTSATARGEMSRRVNLLTATDNYNNVAWNKVRASISPVAALAPDGTLTASKLVEDTTAAADHSLRGQSVAGVVGATYLQSVYLKAGERTSVQFYEVGGPGIFLVNLLNGVVTVIGGASVVNTVDAGSGWWKISYTQVANNAAQVFIYFGLVNPSLVYTGDGVSGVYIWHPSVTLVADSALPYQRVTSASNYDEEGFPAFLRRQTDDWSKAHINPNGATKVFALTAVQKMSDASAGIVLESSGNSNSNNGCILLLAPNAPGTIAFRSNGTVVPTPSTFAGINSPTRTVIGGRGSISPPLSQCIVNGIEGPYITIAQGTGTYTEQDVFFGARAGTSMFVNDREYSPPLILFMQPSDPGISAAAIRKLTKLFSKGIRL